MRSTPRRHLLLLLALSALAAAPGCAPERATDDGALAADSDLSHSADIANRARILWESKNGIDVDEALTRAAVDATAAGGVALDPEAVDVDYLVHRLGAAALPFLVERPWRREHVLAEWTLTESNAAAIVRALAARGAADVVANAIDALLHNPSLDDAFKRQLLRAHLNAATIDARGHCSVDAALASPMTASALSAELLSSHEPRHRSLLASLLAARTFGFETIPATDRRSAIDALLADEDFTVRLAASRLFWEASDTSRAAQARLIAVLDDPGTIARVRLDAIFSMGWSRERADMWGTPDGARDRLLEARAVFLGNLIELAPPAGDISFLLEETVKVSSFAGVYAESARHVVDATTLTLPEKAAWLEKLVHGDDDISASVVRFAWAHPELGPSLPKCMGSLAIYRHEPQHGSVRQEDRDTWQAQVQTAAGLQQAFREAFQARGGLVFADTLTPTDAPLVRQILLRDIDRVASGTDLIWSLDALVAKALAAGVSAQALVPAVTRAFQPAGYPHSQGNAVDALTRVAKAPSIDAPTLRGILDVAAPWAAEHLNAPYAISAQAFDTLIALTRDARLTETEREALATQMFAKGSIVGLRRAADVLRAQGVSDAKITSLAQGKPELLLYVSPLPMSAAHFTPLSSRPAVLAAHLGGEPVDEEALRARIDAKLGKPVSAWWPEAMAARRWNATPRPWPSARSLYDTPVAQTTQQTMRLLAGAPDLGTLTDAEVTTFFTRIGPADVAEAYWVEADAARGKSYDALRAAHHEKAPLAWADADARRPSGEPAALEVLFTRPPSASPLWAGALLNAISRSPHVRDDFKRGALLGGMTSGYYVETSADTTWDAFGALAGYAGDQGFVGPRLVRYGQRLRSMADARDLFALEPLLVDARMPADVVRDSILAAVDASLKTADYGWGEHPASPLSALVIRTLDARSDLGPDTRDALLRATDLLLESEVLQTNGERRIRQIVAKWRSADRNGATFSPSVRPGSGPRSTYERDVDGVTLTFVVVYDERHVPTRYWAGRPDAGAVTGWAGPFDVPALGPFDPTR